MCRTWTVYIRVSDRTHQGTVLFEESARHQPAAPAAVARADRPWATSPPCRAGPCPRTIRTCGSGPGVSRAIAAGPTGDSPSRSPSPSHSSPGRPTPPRLPSRHPPAQICPRPHRTHPPGEPENLTHNAPAPSPPRIRPARRGRTTPHGRSESRDRSITAPNRGRTAAGCTAGENHARPRPAETPTPVTHITPRPGAHQGISDDLLSGGDTIHDRFTASQGPRRLPGRTWPRPRRGIRPGGARKRAVGPQPHSCRTMATPGTRAPPMAGRQAARRMVLQPPPTPVAALLTDPRPSDAALLGRRSEARRF
ncbi:hypothetical protein SRB5_12090 [Streptomyces sp. RB5]|uniref:Uncharacterized protein n=1 Tax=Streptomyces smaragdinus TaxID=2585196 RepID=A0A7K0CCB5_9ACTN|nr:hypothetical protein [Streptomyces smaragdinus]